MGRIWRMHECKRVDDRRVSSRRHTGGKLEGGTSGPGRRGAGTDATKTERGVRGETVRACKITQARAQKMKELKGYQQLRSMQRGKKAEAAQIGQLQKEEKTRQNGDDTRRLQLLREQ